MLAIVAGCGALFSAGPHLRYVRETPRAFILYAGIALAAALLWWAGGILLRRTR